MCICVGMMCLCLFNPPKFRAMDSQIPLFFETTEGAASASGGGGGEVSSGVQELLNLGFTKEQAEEALRRTNGDVSFAASLLLAESSGDH